ncbi:TonB-dependent receptor [Dyella psychrodurans]|uniref:Oar protein n=1 Tax=Dyella psychrodurans TaxID=1927960 RepID=A0A370X4P0_9GAMM|nr:TonB-dependent receptor [Dyella psychrodurans]RDS83302.1 Oar protein [Dyella psychrodurans]
MNNRLKRINNYRRNALTAALAVSMGFTGYAYGQATTGSVFGTAPVSAGETVRVVNNQTGLTRVVAVDSAGRYSANQLPTGDYTVSLMQGGNVVSTQDHVQVTVQGGTNVPFAAPASAKNAQNLSTITVSANAVPAIDVSSTRQTQVITAQQLKTLPIAHSAEAIALLAPGVSGGGSSLGTGPTGAPLVSMGGNSVVENAYYLNGFNTTDPIGGAGGISLPYFAISEQQTITSGYGPEYGRSTGGVISQIGQRGSNQWHAGVYVSTRPGWAESDYDNIKYSNPLTPVGTLGYNVNPATGALTSGPYMAQNQGVTNYLPGYGQIQRGRKQDSDWENVYDAYLSGPLIKDKLFFFITAEWQHDSNDHGTANYGMVSPSGYYESSATNSPKLYGKLDWNINDSNVLELTGVRSQQNETSDNFYQYNYSNQSVANYYSPGVLFKNTYNIGILKYTSYITDDLTLELMYGVMGADYYSSFAGGQVSPVTFGTGFVVPPGVVAPQLVDTSLPNPSHTTKTENLRIDLDWKVTENHDLKFGIDNVQYRDDNDGATTIGGGTWNYFTGTPSSISAAPFLNGAGNVTGNYVQQSIVQTDVSIASREKAQYVEDRWQVMPNLLLDLGLRNDQFVNTGPGGEAYVKENSPQWAPRLGASWDVFGDSTFKVFGNAGRYYLALPAGLAGRNPQFGSINGSVVYTYTGISSNGQPTGLTVVPVANTGGPVPGFFSSDGENGGAHGNIKNYASTNLKPQYQDEYVLGMQKQLGDTGLVWGAQATWEKAGNLVDDTDVLYQGGVIPGLVNPGKTNYIPQAGGYAIWNPNTGAGLVCNGAFGTAPGNCSMPVPSRKYYALENYLEHSWDGKWYAKVDYVFSKSYGSTEGPTDTPIGQITNQRINAASGSTTAQWDFPDLMEYANGEQANSHRHTLKAFGSYAITPEWMVSGTYIIQSGAPNVCLSGYGSEILPDLYSGPYQHFCGGTPANNGTNVQFNAATGQYVLVGSGGQPSPPGDSGHTPWTHQLNLALTYTPLWANKHLTLQWEIHNVFNEQAATLYYTEYAIGIGPGPNGNNQGTGYLSPVYHTAQSTETPRYMDFNVKFDW